MNDREQRRSFRVHESAFVKYAVLSELDFDEGLERRKLRHGLGASVASTLSELDARLNQAMQRLHNEAGLVGKCLALLNEKMDVVINQMPEFRKAKSELASLQPQLCEISADGIVFSAATLLPLDTRLHIEILLESDNRFIDSFGTVVRHVDPPNGNDPKFPYGIAVEFRGMKPELRETLIQHMFTQESQTLRMRRLELESDS